MTSAILAFVLAVPPAGDVEPPAPPLPRSVRLEAAAVDELIAALDSPSFAVRRQATRELVAAGAAVARPLGIAARRRSLEVAVRAISVLERLYVDPDEATALAAEEVLEKLADQGTPRVVRRALRVLEAHAGIRQRRTVEQVRQLGGLFKDRDDNLINPNDSEWLGKRIPTLQLGRRWKGGDAGLRFVRRLSRLDSLLVIDGAGASEAAIVSLQSKMPDLKRIVRRGTALLGILAVSSPCQIMEVRPGLSADRAGLLAGDKIIRFGNKEVGGFQELVDLIKNHKPGDRVPIVVVRMVKTKEVELPLTVVLDDWETAVRRKSKPVRKSLKKPVPRKR